MYSPYARSLLTKLLQDAHEDEDEIMARTFKDLASDPTRWPEVREFFLSDQKEWPAIAEKARRAADARLEGMVARVAVRVREEDEQIEAEAFYRLLAEHHVHTNPDAELLCLIHKPRFQRRWKSAYEHLHGEWPGESPLSEVTNSDDEGDDHEEPAPPSKGEKKKRLIVIVNRGETGEGRGEGKWERLAREAREGKKRKRDEDEEIEKGEVVEGGPRKWTKTERVVRAEEKEEEEDFEDVWIDDFIRGEDDLSTHEVGRLSHRQLTTTSRKEG